MLTSLVLLAFAWSPSLAVQSLVPFRGVSISKATVTSANKLEQKSLPSGSFTKLHAASLCLHRQWCDVWCRDNATNQYLLTDLAVYPGYEEAVTADVLDCFTRRPKDFATGATILAQSEYSGKIAAHLVDGYFDPKTNGNCFHTTPSRDDPWFLLDFGEAVAVRKVKLYAQNLGASLTLSKTSNLEVRVGREEVSSLGDFGSYKVFGFFKGPATQYSQEVLLEVGTPLVGRYLSVQKLGPQEYFQLCHIEVT